jgi:hypothetical protein
MGSNAIQAKGGTRNIRIEANFFRNCGQRTLNLGGSTGLQFFRPLDAPYEAADLKVYSNVFIGSVAPVAFVGCINTEVINNTVYLPENWVLRILQETVDTSRFFPCRDNTFRNNLIVVDNQVNVVCNIGPNTAPETFTFSNNLWFHLQQPAWAGPVLPVTDQNSLINQDPLLVDPDFEDFTLLTGSPAVGAGLSVILPTLDYAGVSFNDPPSIGAFEGTPTSGIRDTPSPKTDLQVFPNPTENLLTVLISAHSRTRELMILSPAGDEALALVRIPAGSTSIQLDTAPLPSGIYFLRVVGSQRSLAAFVKH